jgi:uncharacterized membrane protein
MRKIKAGIVILLVFAVSLIAVFSVSDVASANGDENYNDYSNEYAKGEQPDPEDVPGMDRTEDRTRNKDS